MTNDSSENDNANVQAARELTHLHAQTAKARVLLNRLQQDMVKAGSRSNERSSLLLEANEQLVLTAVRAQIDAEQRGRALEKVARAAQHDDLTELPNRMLLLDRFAQAIATAKRHGTRLALLFLDLDYFKQINDTHGHAVGDEVLKRVAQCLADVVRGNDTVSRHGGDEFLVLLAEVSQAADATLIADKMLTALARPYRIGTHQLSLTASIGISIYPDHGEDADTLIDRADEAMYHAKKHRLGSYTYRDDEFESIPSLLELPPAPSTTHKLALVEHERRHAQLREANEQLLLAALSAQDLQANAELAQLQQTEFLAVLAHELRNPLAPISTAAALLGRMGTNEPHLVSIQGVIERQVVHLSRLVGDLLDVSRVHTGKLRLERRVIDLTGIIDEAIDNCRPALHTRLQRFDVQMPPVALDVYGDPVRLTQILSNLLDNASKYTKNGGEISLTVEIIFEAIAITITDNGIGITAEALPYVFEPFVQDPHATGFNGGGLGIGLTVVRELVEAHGGSVIAHSAGAELGSQFVVTLPVAGRSHL